MPLWLSFCSPDIFALNKKWALTILTNMGYALVQQQVAVLEPHPVRIQTFWGSISVGLLSACFLYSSKGLLLAPRG